MAAEYSIDGRGRPSPGERLCSIEVLLFDVIGNGGINEFTQGPSGLYAFADGSGGDGVLKAVQKMNSYTGEQEAAYGCSRADLSSSSSIAM